MLEGESSVGSCIEPENGLDSMSSSEGEKIRIIDWSPTGRAFRITDVSAFSSLILPKYFRTNNFSSFQRNLNLVSSSACIQYHISLCCLFPFLIINHQ